MKHFNPPKWPFKLVSFFLKKAFAEELEGDMEERFHDNLDLYGHTKARRLYLIDTLKLIRPSLLKRTGGDYKLNYYGMLINNLKISWRQMVKQKVFSSIKIGGLAVGICACILITVYVAHQTTYDQHYKEGSQVFRLVNRWAEVGETGYWSNVHGPLKPILEDNIPEIDRIARIVLWPWGDAVENQFRPEEAAFSRHEKGFIYADPELLGILEIPMVYGSQRHALKAPNTMVISKRKADVYFPNQNPIGKNVVLNNNTASTYVIAGVMEDFPATSHLQGDFILTLSERNQGPGTSGWCCTNYNMYVKLHAGSSKVAVENKTAKVRNSLVIDQLREAGEMGLEEMKKYQSYYLQPVKDIYLNPEEVDDYFAHGSQELVWILGVMATIILLLAVINFINLSVANSLSRAKETGLRKVVGSTRSSLIFRYLVDSCIYCFLSVLLGVLFTWTILPFFNHLADVALTVPWTDLRAIGLLLGITILVGILSGIYPAFVLSRFKPIAALKGDVKGKKNSVLRSGMVVLQFTATAVLIIGALFIHGQFSHIMNKSLGYNKERVVNLLDLDSFDEQRRLSLKEELLKLSAIEEASLSDYLPVEGGAIQNRGYWLEGRKEQDIGFEAARWVVDEDYLSMMQIKLEEGRNFKASLQDEHSIIVNQQMVHALGLDNPIGHRIVDMFDEKYTIIGVVNDFYFESLLLEMRPLALVNGRGASTLSFKIKATDTALAMADVFGLWDTFSPKQAIRFTYMDQRFESMYDGLDRAKVIFLAFAFLSVVVACLGLLALSMYMIQQRGKEMSVRKVLGASVPNIFMNLTMDFLKMVLLSVALAIPIGWYFADFLLEDFANRINLSWEIFALASILSIIMAVITVSYGALRTAFYNPAKQLRMD